MRDHIGMLLRRVDVKLSSRIILDDPGIGHPRIRMGSACSGHFIRGYYPVSDPIRSSGSPTESLVLLYITSRAPECVHQKKGGKGYGAVFWRVGFASSQGS